MRLTDHGWSGSGHSASPTPYVIANAPVDIVYLGKGAKEPQEPQLAFNIHIQWSTPDSWEALRFGGWQTPDKVIVKLWSPEKGPLDVERAVALAAQGGDFSAIKFDPPSAVVTQGDLRLLMVSGKGQEGLDKRRAVDWHACLTAPLDPEGEYGHGFIVAIGPRGEGTKVQQTLLKVAETVQISQGGAKPAKLVIRRY